MAGEDFSALIANCAKEPIHIPGSIQPHGALLAFTEPDMILAQASANTADIMGVAVEQALGRPIEELLTPGSAEAVRAALRSDILAAVNPLSIDVLGGQTVCDGILHRSGGLAVLELEPRSTQRPADFLSFYHRIRSLTRLIQEAQTLKQAYQIVAVEVQKITGFDRVLVYRFDAAWNGQVVGEAKRPDQESFLDLRYPASDIPPQARSLYERNWLRLIPNVDYKPAALVPGHSPVTGEPLDLSLSVLRSVSPVHLQYLQNFGARASMSISIMKSGSLWGLITCAHRQAHFVEYDVRSACEFVAQALSFKVANLESVEEYEERLKTGRMVSALKRQVAEHGIEQGLTRLSPNLGDMVAADGAALILGAKVVRLGATPAEADIVRLVAWLRQNKTESVYATESLPRMFALAESFRNVACGLLAVSLGGDPGRYILWFRPEVVATVNWGGDPRAPVEADSGSDRFSPRRSFALWQEQVRLCSEKWDLWEIEGAGELRRGVIDATHQAETEKINVALEAEAAKLSSLNAAKDEFLAIVSHDLRSPLNVIVGYAEILRHEVLGTLDFNQAIDAILRNAKTQAQLIGDLLDASRIITGKMALDPSAVVLNELVDDALNSVRFAARTKGVQLQVQVDDTLAGFFGDVERLKQVLWNLLSNAIKFSPAGGTVTLEVRRKESTVEFRISDTGQGIDPAFLPFVFERFRQENSMMIKRHGGLGLGLSIVKHIAELHGGSVYAESQGKDRGATFSVTIPMNGRTVDKPVRTLDPAKLGSSPVPTGGSLAGLKVLVVDDEVDAQQLIIAVLSRGGARVSPAATVEQGLALVAECRFDVIVCDINLGIEDGRAFVSGLRRHEREERAPPTPVIAITAYAGAAVRQEVLSAGFQAMLAKPVLGSELTKTVAELGARAKV